MSQSADEREKELQDAILRLVRSLTSLAHAAHVVLERHLQATDHCEVCDAVPTLPTPHGPRCAFHGLHPEALAIVIARRQSGTDLTDELARYRASASQDPRNYCALCNHLDPCPDHGVRGG